MADVVSEGRRLLAEAKPDAWGYKEAQLVVFALNHLAALLDCADALRDAEAHVLVLAGSHAETDAVTAAVLASVRAALARLEGDTE